MTPTSIAGYLALFFAVGFVFLFANLMVGKLLRPKSPNVEKLQVYECGEPAIGSSFVQFDLRFYVVALLFIIFDVEVAFFFPWGAVYGKATHLMDPRLPMVVEQSVEGAKVPRVNPAVTAVYEGLGVPAAAQASVADAAQIPDTARLLAWTSILDILVFFAVLMVGFAYVWRRGDLDWVRALSLQRARQPTGGPAGAAEEQPVLVA